MRTIPIVPRTAAKRPGSATRAWTVVIFVGGLLGVVGGIAGFFVSLLTLVGVIVRNRVSDGIAVASIVIALSSLFGAAHGMDKIREIEKREKRERFMKELTKGGQ